MSLRTSLRFQSCRFFEEIHTHHTHALLLECGLRWLRYLWNLHRCCGYYWLPIQNLRLHPQWPLTFQEPCFWVILGNINQESFSHPIQGTHHFDGWSRIQSWSSWIQEGLRRGLSMVPRKSLACSPEKAHKCDLIYPTREDWPPTPRRNASLEI